MLGKYTNADTSLFYLKSLGNLLTGNFKYRNIMLKTEEVNERLSEANAPFLLKMGVLGKFELKFSILNQVLEKVYIEDFILIIRTKFTDISKNFNLTAEQKKVNQFYRIFQYLPERLYSSN